MSKIRRLSNANHLFSYLSEKSRKELVTKSLKQSPERVARSTKYRITGKVQINVDGFIDRDELEITFPVNQYRCTLLIHGFIERLIHVVDRQWKGNVNFDAVEKALSQVIDNDDSVLVNCTCPDFYYRFSYVATKNKYKQGKRQDITAPITNPRDDKGSCCKHLLMILKNKKVWLRKVTSVLNYLVKEYYEKILQVYDLDSSTFFINRSGQHSPKTSPVPTNKRSKLNKDKFIDKDNDEDEEEELQLRIPNSNKEDKEKE